ncbi:hypothetical protein [Bifidobacterium subtile]|uniref:hypothetical protein n=1 Tax=Bifidobacterium subtile TaxID=77635 RepID=UPI0012E02D18|nr:hypothetical protein [Bifidobacterium subtile]
MTSARLGTTYKAPLPRNCNNAAANISSTLSNGHTTIIATINLADFPPKTLEKYGIRAEHPDAFLSRVYDESPEAVRRAITRMAARKKHPPRIMTEEYAGLKKAGLATFAARLEA